MPLDEFDDDDGRSAVLGLKLGVSRLTEALQALDGAGVPLAASYVHLAIHMCVTELKEREKGARSKGEQPAKGREVG